MSAEARPRFVLAGREQHALIERTVGPALCGFALADGATWLLHGFTRSDVARIGCADCRGRAEAMIAARGWRVTTR